MPVTTVVPGGTTEPVMVSTVVITTGGGDVMCSVLTLTSGVVTGTVGTSVETSGIVAGTVVFVVSVMMVFDTPGVKVLGGIEVFLVAGIVGVCGGTGVVSFTRVGVTRLVSGTGT